MIYLYVWAFALCLAIILLNENRTVFRWKPVGDRTSDGGPQIYRMRILYTPWFRVALHSIHRPDNMRYGLHDHPWNFWSIVLWGWYKEKYLPEPGQSKSAWLYAQHRVRGLLSFAYRPARYTHAIESVCRKGCLTLIVQSARIGSPRFRHTRAKWGFPGIGKSFDQVQDGPL